MTFKSLKMSLQAGKGTMMILKMNINRAKLVNNQGNYPDYFILVELLSGAMVVFLHLRAKYNINTNFR